MNLKDFAKSLPYPVKQGLKYIYGAIPPGMSYGKVFWDTYSFLQESQWWSREKLEEYQMQQLSRLLHHAYENVPYYRRVFDERGLKLKDIQDFDDLKKLPILTKDAFKKEFKSLIANNFNIGKCHKTHTSGTTGKPMQFYQREDELAKEWAFVCHQWRRIGYKPGDARIEIRGQVDTKHIVSYNPARKVLRLSPIISTEEIAKYYIDRINSSGIKFIHGYPSAIYSFALTIKNFSIPVNFKLKAILLASEQVYDWEAELIEEVFKIKTFNFYGMAEHVAIASECEKSRCLHFAPQYGIVEIASNTGGIIATGFLNYVNPFIRYKITDMVEFPVKKSCKPCGRSYYPVVKGIQGREEDLLISTGGVIISPAVITHPFKDLKTIKNTQIVQKSLNYIKLGIAPWDDCDPKMLEDELQQLCQGLQKILGPDVKIETERVQSIQLSRSGKFKWIISEISKDFLQKGLREA